MKQGTLKQACFKSSPSDILISWNWKIIRKFSELFVIVIFVLIAYALCPSNGTSNSDACYWIVSEGNEAAVLNMCKGLNGTLASIPNQAVSDFITTNLNSVLTNPYVFVVVLNMILLSICTLYIMYIFNLYTLKTNCRKQVIVVLYFVTFVYSLVFYVVSCILLFVCLSFSFLALALSVYFRFMSLTVLLVSFVPLLLAKLDTFATVDRIIVQK